MLIAVEAAAWTVILLWAEMEPEAAHQMAVDVDDDLLKYQN